jgi:hypothetical protein
MVTITENTLRWAEDYDDDDLLDAIDHYNLMANRSFSQGIDYGVIENIGTKTLDPENLLGPQIKHKKPKGWLKMVPKSQWLKEFENIYNRNISHILDNDKIKPPILISGDLCDGFARVILAYSLNEQIPISIFECIE